MGWCYRKSQHFCGLIHTYGDGWRVTCMRYLEVKAQSMQHMRKALHGPDRVIASKVETIPPARTALQINS